MFAFIEVVFTDKAPWQIKPMFGQDTSTLSARHCSGKANAAQLASKTSLGRKSSENLCHLM